MKKFLLLLPAILLVGLDYIGAQTSNEALTNVSTPSSPASTIIGTKPNTIEKPKSWESFEAAVFTNYLDSNNKFVIPDNYSLEFTPYWAMRKKPVSMSNFLTPSPGISALQNLSFSISSSNNFIVSDSIKTNALGFGIRTMIWQGTKNEIAGINKEYGKMMSDFAVTNRIQEIARKLPCTDPCSKDTFMKMFIRRITDQRSTVFADCDMKKNEQLFWISEYEAYLAKSLPKDENYSSAEKRENLIDEPTDAFTKIDTLISSIETLRSDRKGFKLEIATALALNFPTNNVNFSYGSKYGISFTPSFQPFKKTFQWVEFMGVLRYYWFNQDFNAAYKPTGGYYENNFDYGFKAALKFKKLSFEMEASGRSSSVVISRVKETDGSITKKTNSKSDSQYIATLTYQVNEKISISYNFGKTFMPVMNYKGNLLSMATINFGLGAPKVKDIQ